MNKIMKKILLIAIFIFMFAIGVQADVLSLYTTTVPLYHYDANTQSYVNYESKVDKNWDYYHDVHRLNPAGTTEDAIYLMPFDGGSGHSNDPQADGETDPIYWTLDGLVEGNYSTMDMGTGGSIAAQSFGVTTTDINLYPKNQRDTRAVAIFNTEKIFAVNSDPGAVLKATFRWSIDEVMPWAGGFLMSYAPTTIYVSIYPDVNATSYWRSPPDTNDPNIPTIYYSHTGAHVTDYHRLQHEFDPSGAGIQFAEKAQDIRVDYGSGLEPLTDEYLQIYGPQVYELDFTDEVRQILKLYPDLQWIGFTIRGSHDGDNVLLKMYAGSLPGAIPPTLEIQVTKYTGDLNDNNSVDFVDFALFSKDYGGTDDFYKGDLNVDSEVTLADLAEFGQNWLAGK